MDFAIISESNRAWNLHFRRMVRDSETNELRALIKVLNRSTLNLDRGIATFFVVGEWSRVFSSFLLQELTIKSDHNSSFLYRVIWEPHSLKVPPSSFGELGGKDSTPWIDFKWKMRMWFFSLKPFLYAWGVSRKYHIFCYTAQWLPRYGTSFWEW